MAEGARLFKYAFYVTVAVFVFGGLGAPGAFLWLIFGTYIVAVSRARVAEVYGIPLNQVENWCLSLWCNCCVATQVNAGDGFGSTGFALLLSGRTLYFIRAKRVSN